MNEEQFGTPTPKRASKRKPATPRAPRVIDPAIKAIHDRMKLDVAAHRAAQTSAKILKTVLEKFLPNMDLSDLAILLHAIHTRLPTTESVLCGNLQSKFLHAAGISN